MRGGGDGAGARLDSDECRQQQQHQVLPLRGLRGAHPGQVRDAAVGELLARGVPLLLPVSRPATEQLLLQGGKTLLQD